MNTLTGFLVKQQNLWHCPVGTNLAQNQRERPADIIERNIKPSKTNSLLREAKSLVEFGKKKGLIK